MGATSLHSYQLHAPHLTHHSLLLPPLPCTTAALLSHHATRLIVRILRSCETRKDKHEKKSKRHRFHSKKGWRHRACRARCDGRKGCTDSQRCVHVRVYRTIHRA